MGATIWLKKIFLEQFKKEDYGKDMREWISKLISINEILSTVGDGKNIYDLNQFIWENRVIK